MSHSSLHLTSGQFSIRINIKTFKVSDKEFSEAFKFLEPDFRETLTFCSENVKKFHEKQMPKKEWMIEMHSGVYAGEKIEPIETVALYVPRGKGSFPSVAMMTSIPAVVAGVKKPIIFTPPEIDGSIDSATLVALTARNLTLGGMPCVSARVPRL